MTLSKLLSSLIKHKSVKDKCSEIYLYLKQCYAALELAYFEHNSIHKKLIEINGTWLFELNDYSNPIVFNYLEGKICVTNKIDSYVNDSNFRRYSNSKITNKYCLLHPSDNLGIWVIYNDNKSLFEDVQFLDVLHLIITSFCEAEKLHKRLQYLEYRNVLLLQEFNQNISKNYDHIQQHYIEENWIDESVQGRRLKRLLPNISKNDRTLTIVGGVGYGKSHLANIIHHLRNTSFVSLRELNLFDITNIVQLNQYVKHAFSEIDIYTKETLVVYNVEYLSEKLIKRLIFLLSELNQPKKQVKVILTITPNVYFTEKSILNFFTDEVIILENRILQKETKHRFLQYFLNSKKKFMATSFLDEDTENFIVEHNDINTISKLIFFVELLCHRYHRECLITMSNVENLLTEINWKQFDSLVFNLEFFERKLILDSLIETNWNQKISAERLMIPRRTLNYKCQKYGLYKYGK